MDNKSSIIGFVIYFWIFQISAFLNLPSFIQNFIQNLTGFIVSSSSAASTRCPLRTAS